MSKSDQKTTHFGYREVPLEEKAGLVGSVFDSVASRYDLMNDVMSLGLHRLWKRIAIERLDLRPGQTVLDLAGGSGDLTQLILPRIGKTGRAILADINTEMLAEGQDRLINAGKTDVDILQLNAEALPFADNSLDRIIIGFGLRNVTTPENALASMYRTLKPGGRAVVLEFSHVTCEPLKSAYDFYSFHLLPQLGKWIANDEDSYRYLAESIRKHPDQETLKERLLAAGFDACDYRNLLGGIVAIHWGVKH